MKNHFQESSKCGGRHHLKSFAKSKRKKHLRNGGEYRNFRRKEISLKTGGNTTRDGTRPTIKYPAPLRSICLLISGIIWEEAENVHSINL